MIQKPHKCFMSEEGGTPASAAAPAPSAEPTAVPTAPSLDVDALLSRFVSVVDEKLAAHKNATFAELRKAGAFSKEKSPSEQPASVQQPTPSAPVQAQAGLTQADVEALLERESVIATRAAKHNLTESQTRRLKSALSGVSRESFATEADAYLADMGIVKAAPVTPPATPTTPQAATPAPAKPNISDRGTAAPTDLRDFEGVLNSRPLEMTRHDVDDLILKHGQDKGMQMFQERVLAALGRVRIKPPRG